MKQEGNFWGFLRILRDMHEERCKQDITPPVKIETKSTNKQKKRNKEKI